jgi:hypothetical protein
MQAGYHFTVLRYGVDNRSEGGRRSGGLVSLKHRARLRRYAIDRVRTEFCVSFADLAQLLELRVVAPSLNPFHAVPNLHHGPLGRLAIEAPQLHCAGATGSADRKRTAAVRLDELLHLQCVFLTVGVRIGHFDFRDVVDGRLDLRLQPLHRAGAKGGTDEHGKSNGG